MWQEALAGAVGAVVGGGLGAGLTGWFAIKADKKRIQREQVSKTYGDFLSHLAAVALAGGGDETGAAKSKLAAAIARIAVYGDVGVVERLGEFVEARNVRDPKIVDVVEAMREHVGKKQGVSTESLKAIVMTPRASRAPAV